MTGKVIRGETEDTRKDGTFRQIKDRSYKMEEKKRSN